MTSRAVFVAVATLLFAGVSLGADSLTEPRPIPLTRPELKDLLEDLKARQPRIPLPELSAEEREQLGNRADDYEFRLRHHYMPRTEGRGGEFGRGGDPNMSLDYAFKTMMFWIVSRMNNCQYCLGHQEIKLAVAGLEEDKIAALDGSWAEFSPEQQAAFAFARKLTYEPHLLADDDIARLRKHYTDLQILEIILSVCGNNSINRWKEGVGVPQSKSGRGFLRRGAPPEGRILPIESFLTPTADKYKDAISKVAPIHRDESTGQSTRLAVIRRPPLEPPEEVEKTLAICRTRKPRLPLLTDDAARSVMGGEWPNEAMPIWVRLMANFPQEGKSRAKNLLTADQTGDLKPLLKAQVRWIVARQDRAWYAVAEAKRRLNQLGISDDQVYELDGSSESFSPAERSMFNVARKLAASPIVLTDTDVKEAVNLTSPRDVVQLISYVTSLAYFNRVTEAAGLPVDE